MRSSRDFETGLTEKEELFCQSYIDNGGNATQAYINAFGRGNMRQQELYQKSSVLHSKDIIRSRISAIREERARQSAVSREVLTMKLASIASFDIGRLFKTTDDGLTMMKDLNEMTTEERSMIQSFDRNGNPVLIDKMQALKLLADVNGLKTQTKVEVKVGGMLGELVGNHNNTPQIISNADAEIYDM